MPRTIAPLFALLSVCAIALSGGCASNPRATLPKQFPADVRDWNGQTLARVEFLRDFAAPDYARVRVEPVGTGDVVMPPADENTHEPVARVLSRAGDLFAESLRAKLRPTPVETSFAAAGSPGRTLLVRLRVLEMDPGSQAKRYWVGFGSGASTTRFAGEVVDGTDGRVLLRFEQNDSAGGGAFGGGYTDLLSAQVRRTGNAVGTLLACFDATGPKPPTAPVESFGYGAWSAYPRPVSTGSAYPWMPDDARGR